MPKESLHVGESGATFMTDARLAGLPAVAMAARAVVASTSAAAGSSRDARDEPFPTS
jgi:hypothetical protein